MPSTNRQQTTGLIMQALTDHPGISRTELTQKLGRSSSTISTAVQYLLQTGMIYQQTALENSGGRPRKLLFRSSDLNPYWVADISPEIVRIAVVSPTSNRWEQDLSAGQKVPLPPAASPETALRLIIGSLEKLSRKTYQKSIPQALGLSLPGPVDRTNGRIVGSAHLPNWNQQDLRQILQNLGLVNCPLFLENDAQAQARGELVFQGPEQLKSAIYLKAGMAIGGAAIINSQVYQGGNGLGGDLTHNQVNLPQPIPCSCGRSDCLETVASGQGLLRLLKEEDGGYNHRPITTLSQLVEQANQANPLVTALVRKAGQEVGKVLAPLVTFLNPQAVVIGGQLAASVAFNAGIKSELYANCLPMITANIRIETAQAGVDSALLGLLSLCQTGRPSINEI